jgi:hypothetical protein
MGADVNVLAFGPKSPGATPLHLAAAGGHLKVMNELLERGADIDARTKGGCGCKFDYSTMSFFFLFGLFPTLCWEKKKKTNLLCFCPEKKLDSI